MRSLKVTSVLLFIVSCSAFAQAVEEYYQKAKEHYNQKEYRQALYYLKKFIARDSSRAEAYKWRGNCYFDINQLDSARADYEKALKLSPGMSELHYNLSSIYVEKKQYDQAENSLRKFLKAQPDDTRGLLAMANLMRENKADSALYLITRAYSIDSTDQYVVLSLADEYYSQGDFSNAIAFSRRGLHYNPHDGAFLHILAYSSFGIGHYQEAGMLADSLIRKEPESLLYQILKSKAAILQHTPDLTLRKKGFELTFTSISSERLDSLDKLVGDPAGKYYYPALLSRFRQGEALGLDEYFMAYYGFTTDSRYSPYGVTGHSLQKEFEAEDYDAIISACKEMLKNDEFNPRHYQYLAIAQFRTGLKDDAQVSLTKYLGLIEGILATGNGASAREAYIVTAPSHEYKVCDYLGLESTMQSLVNEGGHSFDVLSTEREDKTKKDIYFNIDKPFGSLGQMFKDTDKSGKKKKNKKG